MCTIDRRRSIAIMLRFARPWGVCLLSVAALACVPEIDLAGRPCPCADGYVCDVSVNLCVRGDGPGAGSGGAGPATTGTGGGPVGVGGATTASAVGSGGATSVGSGGSGGGGGGGGGCPVLADPGTFPTPGAQIFDHFDSPDGPLVGNWTGDIDDVLIDELELWLLPVEADVSVFWGTPLCPDQEVFATVPWIDNLSTEIMLTLKSQQGGECDRIVVIYSPLDDILAVQYCTGTDWGPYLGVVPFDMSPGDVFGARARQDGSVEVYVNGELITDGSVQEWPFYAQGGHVGLAQYLPEEGQYWDDFGGH